MTSSSLGSFRCRLTAALVLCVTLLSLSASRADDAAARWYKGNTHAHSFWSDGDEFPEMVADWYKSHGYDFLAISDHDRLMEGEKWVPVDQGKRFVPTAVLEKCRKRFGHDWLTIRTKNDIRQVKLKTLDEVRAKVAEPAKFLLIQAEEIATKVGDRNVHINAINLVNRIDAKRAQTVAEALSLNLGSVEKQADCLGRTIVAQVNHPDWVEYDITAEDLASAANFFEVCNGGPWGHHAGDATHPGIEQMWDIANTIRIAKMKAPPLCAVAADDAHNYQQFSPSHANPGRAYIMVQARELSAGAIVDAIARGDCYASTGVTLRTIVFDSKQGTLAVEVNSEPGVQYTIEFVGTLEGVDSTGAPVKTTIAHGTKPARPGHTYSPEIGKVLSSVKGAAATYQLTGKELYVRAVVRSDKPIPNAPSGAIHFQEAWCQPVGWHK